MDRYRESQGWTTACSVVCPNVTGRTRERIAQKSKRARAGSLALLTSHKWREVVSSGCCVCRSHAIFLWCYACFVLHRFRIYAFVEAAAVRSIVCRYAGAAIATRVSFFFSLLFIWRCRFLCICFVPFPLSLCMETTSYVLSFRMVFFYLVTTGWIFYISLCENSINKKSQ